MSRTRRGRGDALPRACTAARRLSPLLVRRPASPYALTVLRLLLAPEPRWSIVTPLIAYARSLLQPAVAIFLRSPTRRISTHGRRSQPQNIQNNVSCKRKHIAGNALPHALTRGVAQHVGRSEHQAPATFSRPVSDNGDHVRIALNASGRTQNAYRRAMPRGRQAVPASHAVSSPVPPGLFILFG